MAKELWDAYDKEGRRLGFDLVRGEPAIEGAWHIVVEIYSFTTNGRVLVTKRHPEKPWGGYWEITGGSAVKGEGPVRGALRELREETGIAVEEADLRPVYVETQSGEGVYPTIYHCFLVVFDPKQQRIPMQEGETADYRLMPYAEFKGFVFSDNCVPSLQLRFKSHQAVLDRLAAEYIGKL